MTDYISFAPTLVTLTNEWGFAAGSSYSLVPEPTGLSLHFSGFPDVVPKLFHLVTSAMVALSPADVASRFERQKGKLQQQLTIWHQNNPSQHAQYAAEHLLTAPHFHVDENLQAVAEVSQEAVMGCVAMETIGTNEILISWMTAYQWHKQLSYISSSQYIA